MSAAPISALNEIVPSVVCVVGNGPLSDSDRAVIDMFDCVIRFNDMKNRCAGEKVTILATRYDVATAATASFRLLVVTTVHQLPPNMPDPDAPSQPPWLRPIYVYERQAPINDLPPSTESFGVRHDTTTHGPSTGCAVVEALVQCDHVTTIHVFGFNWAGDTTRHIDFLHPHLVPGATKVIVHCTASSEYLQHC
jgi:hypothetical protein